MALLAASAVARAADDPILITLNEVKTHYRKHEIGEAAAALRRLNELAAAPEFAVARDRLIPVLSFYTGAIQFELRDEAGARLALERYFGLQPGATLDPGLYPKPFVKFFERVKKELADADRLAAPPSSPGSIEGGVLPSFAEFALDEEAADAMDRDPAWGSGPVRFLFVADDARRWKSAADEDARRRFQQEFWARRDPTPATPGNELRREFARRVQFANGRFSTETQRGAESDRGRVFILLGPPNYAGRSRIEQAEEGVSRATDDFTPRAAGLANPTQGSRSTRTTRLEPGSSRLDTGEKKGSREVWYYRSDRLAKELPFKELRFEFQTKAGYGIGVMQKDAVNLSVLSRMADLIALPK
ncbi:MAG: GWxTD domain-containing protein [Thermoanaerobaculia bacterium]|nr:GWxTD domain-containing protein [Thermoanaerobaculia bacterium]